MDKTFNQVDAICNFYYDAINDLLYFSDQITDILKINPKDEFKPSLNQFLRYVHPDDAEELKNAIETSMSEKKVFQREYRLVRSDQTICYVREQMEFYWIIKAIWMG